MADLPVWTMHNCWSLSEFGVSSQLNNIFIQHDIICMVPQFTQNNVTLDNILLIYIMCGSTGEYL